MVEKARAPILIDLNQFKLHIHVPEGLNLSLHFTSPSRKFYLSLIALVVHEMKRQGRVTSIPLEEHHGLLALLNESVGAGAGSSKREQLLPRIYRKWKDVLPDLEHAPLFRVLGRSKESEDVLGKSYPFTDDEKDLWANLFEYKGSQEHVRLRFSVDKLGASADDVAIAYGEHSGPAGGDGWTQFVEDLRLEAGKKGGVAGTKPERDDIPGTPGSRRGFVLRWKWTALSILLVGIVLALIFFSPALFLQERSEDTAVLYTDSRELPLPQKPSIAVLPFANISNHPEQEYLCDGITEQIITALSRVPEIFVIARNSTFTYKGKPVMVQQVGKDLGVKYVLEGSVHRSGDRVRITAQLVDAVSGGHNWSVRYDRTFSDIFALQDDIALQVIQSLGVRLTEGEQGIMLGTGTRNLEAYLKVLESLEHFRKWTPEGLVLCREKAEEAIVLDPLYPMAWAMVAWSLMLEVHLGFSRSPQEALKEAEKITAKVVDLDSNGRIAHYLSSYVYLFQGDHEKAVKAIQRAEALNPNGADVTAFYGVLLYHTGRPRAAIAKFMKAIRLNPMPPAWYWHNTGICYRLIEDYHQAITSYKKAIAINPDHFSAWTGLTAAYMLSGQKEKAAKAANEVLRIQPEFSLDQYGKSLMHRNRDDIGQFIEALRKAGLPP
jgi:TolB-like protein/Tfp pilus assembly protein PilF